MAELTFTRTKIATGSGPRFELHCEVVQSDQETALFAKHNISSPLDIVLDRLVDHTLGGTIARFPFMTAQLALDEQAAIIHACQEAKELLVELESAPPFDGVETITIDVLGSLRQAPDR